MKKVLVFVLTVVLSLGFVVSASATSKYGTRRHASTATRTNARASRQATYERRDDRSFWEKHRDKLTVGAGAVGGAVIGGLIGGKRGAGIGTLAGGGAAAVYTYKIRKKDRRY